VLPKPSKDACPPLSSILDKTYEARTYVTKKGPIRVTEKGPIRVIDNIDGIISTA